MPNRPNDNISTCENGDFERGEFTSGFSTFISNRRYLENPPSSSYIQTYIPDRHQIVTNGFDNIVGNNLLPMVFEGNYAAKIGNPNLGLGNATSLRYDFIVDQSNANFSFNYAMVLQDPNDGNHTLWQKPYFQYTIISLQNGLLRTERFYSDVNDPFFNVAPGDITWKDWSSACFDLSDYIGDDIVVIFETASCSWGATHFSYAYIDGLCTNNEPTPRFHIPKNLCLDKPIMLYGGSSQKEDSYYISIQKANGGWQSIGPEYSKWFVAQEVGQVNLSSLMQELGGEFECNSNYRIKLAVSNGCVSWRDTTTLIYINCPDIPELEDVYACCDLFNDAIEIGFDTTNNTYDGYHFNWSAVEPNPNYFQNIGDGELISTVPAFAGVALTNSTFSVKVTDNNGCSETQEATLWLIDDFDITIEEVTELESCCAKSYKVNIEYLNGCVSEQPSEEVINEIFDITWSNGQTSQTIMDGSNNEHTLSVTVSNRCGNDQTAQITHIPVSTTGLNYTGDFIAPNTIAPNDYNPVNRELIIRSFGPNVPYLGNTTDDAYGISSYELVIWDRDGHILKTIENSTDNTPNCFFTQGEIRWDGTDENGHIVPDGTYPYYLNVKTCSNPNYQRVCTISTNKLCKKSCWRWAWSLFLGRERYCCEYYEQGAEGNQSGVSQCIYYVRVLN